MLLILCGVALSQYGAIMRLISAARRTAP